MNRWLLWLDNPILVKHARSRLRPVQLFPSIGIVGVISLCVILVGYQYNGMGGGETFGTLLMVESVILGVMGAAQVASSVGKARDSGILDFHRVTPMSPFSMALGFFFGAPIREYLMFAATLPFAMACVFMGRPSLLGFFQLVLPVILGAWVMQAIALLNALGGKGGKSNSGSRGVVGLVMFLIFGGIWFVPGFIGAATAVDATPMGSIFSVRLPWLVILAIDLFPVIGFFLVASTRKIASERAHALSKRQALAALITGATLILGGLWDLEVAFVWTLVVLYALIVGSIVLISAITPGLDEFAKGIRKAAKEGRKFPSSWSDRGLNRVGVFGLCGVVLVASTICWRTIEKPVPWGSMVREVSYSLPIAIGVLVVAYFGLAFQFFRLRHGKRGGTYFALFLFAAWLLPLACGGISAASYTRNWKPDQPRDAWSPALASLSPIAGITLCSGLANVPDLTACRAAALLPALTFALLFNNLVTTARRRVEREIHPEAWPSTKPGDPDEAGIAA